MLWAWRQHPLLASFRAALFCILRRSTCLLAGKKQGSLAQIVRTSAEHQYCFPKACKQGMRMLHGHSAHGALAGVLDVL